MIADATEIDFREKVIEASREAPVVVDFWAEWCGPCRALAPALEAAVAARQGAVRLVKVNTDLAPSLAQSFGIKGIPAVKAFRDGRVVDEFTGVLPRQAIDQFLDAIMPSPADLALRSGDLDALRTALAGEPRNLEARLALGSALVRQGESAEAVEVLEEARHDPAGAGLYARAELAVDPSRDPEIAALLERLDEDPDGTLDALLESILGAESERRDLIRLVMIGVFAERGQDDPLVSRYRRRLASALY